MTLSGPLHFAPIFKTVIWGGEKIASFKGIDSSEPNIGESWEISAVSGAESVVDRGPHKGLTLSQLISRYGASLMGEENFARHGSRFPLLIKLIDAHDNLSVQVHPDDRLAQERHGCNGKTEMWQVIRTEPGARIFTGLREQLTPELYDARVAEGTIMQAVASYESAPGQTYFLPAGRVHAIGAGNLLAEIQQTSDITYRIYDYDRRDAMGRPRQLHNEEARDAIDYTVLPDYMSHPDGNLLVSCPYFEVYRLEIASGETVPIPSTRDSFTILMCLEGEALILHPDGTTCPISRGETLLYPATMRHLQAISPSSSTLLSCQA